MAPEREVRLDALLDGDEPELFEPRDLGLGERLVEEVRERRPSPEPERLAERALGCSGIPARERRATLGRETDEPMDVHALGLDLEDIARGARHDGFRAERLSKLGDVHLDCVRSGLGRVAGPEALDELVDRDDPSGLEREHGEERAGLLPAERDRVSVLQHLQRPEELELDRPRSRSDGQRPFQSELRTEPPECPRPGLSIP